MLLSLAPLRGYCDTNASGVNHVLYISSYSPSSEYNTGLLDGIYDGLDKDTVLYCEYMYTDTVENNDYEQNELIFLNNLKYHISPDIKLDAVIAADDAALSFVLSYRAELFPSAPVVFVGVNNDELAEEALSQDLIVGSSVQPDYKKNIEFAMTVMPNADTVTVITDNSIAGKGMSNSFDKCVEDFPELDFRKIITDEMSEEELISSLSALNSSDIVMFLSFGGTTDRHSYSDYEAVRLIAENTGAPVFTAVDLDLGDGFLGGYVVSPTRYGVCAANAVRQLLDGESLESIDMSGVSASKYKFDYNIIKKFEISDETFPSGASYINYTESFKEKYGRKLAITSVIVIMVLFFIQLISKWFEFRIQNRRLYQAEATLRERLKLSEKNHAVEEEYIDGVSHEIREPLNKIIALAGQAGNDGVFGNIEDTAQSLKNSISEFLDISEPEINTSSNKAKTNTSTNKKTNKSTNANININPQSSGGSRLLQTNPEPFEPQKLIAELDKTFSKQCGEKGIYFTVNKLDLDENKLYGDLNKLTALLSNILLDAVNNTEKGKSISFNITQITQKSDGKDIAVIDFCVTVTAADKDADGQKLVSADNTDFGSESGIGLAIRKKYAAIMDGKITSGGVEGGGYAVTVTIPFKIFKEKAKADMGNKPIEEYDFSGSTALIAEDNELNLAILKEMLKAVSINAICVKDGREAVYTFNKAHFDEINIIFLDSDMPIMSGEEAANTIRKSKHANSATVPIIAMTRTAHSGEPKSGINAYIKKPFDEDELYSLTERYLHSD